MILTVDKTKSRAACLSDSFINMGIPSLSATPTDALSKISTLYRAVVVTSPESIADPADFVGRLRRYMLSVPVFALGDCDAEYADCFDAVIKRGTYAASLLAKITEYCESHGLSVPGSYTLAGIDASVTLPSPRYFWETIPFTKTEALILRALIRSYPTPMRTEDIVEHIYRPTKAPEPANTRTHISLMNKKFREHTGRNLIHTEFGAGYKILTPDFSTVRV